jgi:hypothetical protein
MFCTLLASESLFDTFLENLLRNRNLNISCPESFVPVFEKKEKLMYLGDKEKIPP